MTDDSLSLVGRLFFISHARSVASARNCERLLMIALYHWPIVCTLFVIMTTPPTVLVSAPADPPTPSVSQAKFPMIPLLVAVLTGVVIVGAGVAGSVFYLVRSGRLSSLPRPAITKSVAVVAVQTHMLTLDPLLVNLSDSSGNAYLRISLALRVADTAKQKGSKENEEGSKGGSGESDSTIVVRDSVLAVLGRQTSDDLLAADGKERLKAELKAALTQHDSDLKVADIYFTDFLVQR